MDGTPVPLIAGQAAMSAIALVIVYIIERRKLFAVVEDWED